MQQVVQMSLQEYKAREVKHKEMIALTQKRLQNENNIIINQMKANAKKKGYVRIKYNLTVVGTKIANITLNGMDLYSGDILSCPKYDEYAVIGIETDGKAYLFHKDGRKELLTSNTLGDNIDIIHFNTLEKNQVYHDSFIYHPKAKDVR